MYKRQIYTYGDYVGINRDTSTYCAGIYSDRSSYAAFYLDGASGWVSMLKLFASYAQFNLSLIHIYAKTRAKIMESKDSLKLKETITEDEKELLDEFESLFQ